MKTGKHLWCGISGWYVRIIQNRWDTGFDLLLQIYFAYFIHWDYHGADTRVWTKLAKECVRDQPDPAQSLSHLGKGTVWAQFSQHIPAGGTHPADFLGWPLCVGTFVSLNWRKKWRSKVQSNSSALHTSEVLPPLPPCLCISPPCIFECLSSGF